MATQDQYGAFVPTTNIWDVPGLYQVEDPLVGQLLVRLYQNIGEIALVLNIKTTGFYNTQQYIDGNIWFPNPISNSSDTNATQFRQEQRLVLNVGTLPNTTTLTIPHGITCTTSTSFTHIYGAATNPVSTFSYIPLPYSSATAVADNIEVYADGTNVYITTGADYSAYTISYIVLEFLQS